MTRIVYFVTCPACRRRYPSRFLLRKARDDFSVIDFPAQSAVSLGYHGFHVSDYFNWSRLGAVPSEVQEAFFIFLRRVRNTDDLLRQLKLLHLEDYSTVYASLDDLTAAYPPLEVRYNGY